MKRLALAAMLGLMALAPAQAQTVVKYLNPASIPEEVALMNEAVKEYEALIRGLRSNCRSSRTRRSRPS